MKYFSVIETNQIRLFVSFEDFEDFEGKQEVSLLNTPAKLHYNSIK